MEGVERELLSKMPLAEAVLSVWRSIADEKRLQEIFERHRGRCYEQVITFPVMVQLIADALLEHGGSGNQSFTRAGESGQLEASSRAAYGKLSRLPIGLSVGLFSDLTDCLRKLFPEKARGEPPQTLQDFAVVTIDGKAIKRVTKRLKPLRNARGGVVGGKALVASERSAGLALAMVADPDGDANDVRLVPELLPDVRRRLDGPRLWVADRQFCDLIQLGRFAEDDDAFVVRYNAKVKFQRDPEEASTRKGDPIRTSADGWDATAIRSSVMSAASPCTERTATTSESSPICSARANTMPSNSSTCIQNAGESSGCFSR